MNVPQQTRQDLQRINRALRLLSSCNHALSRSRSETELLSNICRLIVDEGGYLMAWVGFAGHDDNKSIINAASHGHEAGYLNTLHLTWADVKLGQGPTGTSIRTGTVQVNQNFLNNPRLVPWRQDALRRGYQSSIALPLIYSNIALGALSIYAQEADAFNPDEIALLEELSGNLAYGIVALRDHADSERLRSDIRQVETELQGSRNQYRQFVELTSEGVWSLDAQFRTDFVNPALCRMLGYRPEEMLGHAVVDFAFDEDRDRWQQEMQYRQNGTDQRVYVERRYRRKDGSACWCLLTTTWLTGEQGEIVGGFAMVTDITERKATEQALAESREQFQMLVDSSPIAINILYEDRFLFVNPAMERLSGYSRNELLAMRAMDTIHPDSRRMIADRVLARQRGESIPNRYEFRFITKTGEIRWIDVSVSRISYEGKICSLGSLVDITERKREQRQMELMKFSTDCLMDAVSWSTEDARLIYVNDAFCRSLGYTRDELLTMRITDFDPDYPAEMWPQHWQDLKKHGSLTFESRHRDKHGNMFPVEVNVNYIRFGDEEYNCAYVRNISERKKTEEELKLASLVLENAGEGMMVTDENNNIIAINPAFTRITGYNFDEIKGKNPRIFSSGKHDQTFYHDMWQGIVNNGFWQGEIWDRKKDGSELAKFLTISAIRRNDGGIHRHVALFTDITQRKLSDELIWQKANFDTLTGLPNRQMFRDRLAQEAAKSNRTGDTMALLLIDLDHFKEVNDSLGHHWGDMLLVGAAQRIKSCVRESDTVARLGGDEFVIILGVLDRLYSVDRIAEDLVSRLSTPFKLGQDEVYISASIGISLFPDDTQELDVLLKNVDQAMYAAKNSGRNRYSFFTPDMQQSAQMRLHLATDIRMALANNQFRVYYQPIIELATGQIYKAEALIRWHHPTKGLINPADFIPLAEDIGLIVPLGEWIFREAIQNVRKWRKAYNQSLQISVNKSPVQFRHNKNNPYVWSEFLQQQGLPGSALVVEITEGLLMEATPLVNDKLRAYNNAGIEISIDDFGTGYSSLAYLRNFDVDYLKIDRSFIKDLETNRNNQILCEAIIVMAHKLGIRVIAEGVETLEQNNMLKEYGCDFAQGYLFSKPVPAELFEEMLQKNNNA